MTEFRCPLCQRLCDKLHDLKVLCVFNNYRYVTISLCSNCLSIQDLN